MSYHWLKWTSCYLINVFWLIIKKKILGKAYTNNHIANYCKGICKKQSWSTSVSVLNITLHQTVRITHSRICDQSTWFTWQPWLLSKIWIQSPDNLSLSSFCPWHPCTTQQHWLMKPCRICQYQFYCFSWVCSQEKKLMMPLISSECQTDLILI